MNELIKPASCTTNDGRGDDFHGGHAHGDGYGDCIHVLSEDYNGCGTGNGSYTIFDNDTGGGR